MRLSREVFLFGALSLVLLLSAIPVATADDTPAADSGAGATAEASNPHLERAANAKAETRDFTASTDKLMSIIIQSLYSTRDVFLRELISNASDALDKIRFISLTDSNALSTSSNSELGIRVKYDKEKRILTIADNGVGMTKEELAKYLGTIAMSGTKLFQEAAGGDGKSSNDLIGQFGVGFYSAFLVAETVEVTSKSNDDATQWVWLSDSKGKYQIYADPEGNTLGRGTSISLHLREDAQEFLEAARIKALVSKYSEFVNFPIYLWSSKEVEEEVPVEDDKKDDAKKDDDSKDGDVKEVDDDDDKKSEAKTKKVKKTVWDWERMNESKPIWTRPVKEITDDEYNAFYKALTKDYQDPMAHVHFVAEGEMEFRSILYVPAEPPRDMFDAEAPKQSMRLYVRRVFIKDEGLDLLPRYLNFIRGLIDSNDLPLNVSREMLQQSKTLKVIRKKLVRKALELFKDLADAAGEKAPEKKDGEELSDDDKELDEKIKKAKAKWDKFYNAYGKNLKLGLIEDSANKSKLSKLVRFSTSKTESDKDLISLDQYVERMKEGQDVIYYMAGENREHIEASPFLKKFKKHNIEVIFFTDPIDEYAAQTLQEYDSKKIQNIAKEGDIKFGDEDAELSAKRTKAYEEKYKPLTSFIQDKIGSSKLSKVTISERLAGDSPAVLVAGKYSYSAQMERVVKAQALQAGQSYTASSKTLEINVHHPAIRRLAAKVQDSPDAADTIEAVNLLYDTALLTSGYTVDNPASFASRMVRLLRSELGVTPDEPEADDSEIDTIISEKEAEEARKKEEEASSKSDDSDKKDDNDDKDEL
jgi:heat shock protein beta